MNPVNIDQVAEDKRNECPKVASEGILLSYWVPEPRQGLTQVQDVTILSESDSIWYLQGPLELIIFKEVQ